MARCQKHAAPGMPSLPTHAIPFLASSVFLRKTSTIIPVLSSPPTHLQTPVTVLLRRGTHFSINHSKGPHALSTLQIKCTYFIFKKRFLLHRLTQDWPMERVGEQMDEWMHDLEDSGKLNIRQIDV